MLLDALLTSWLDTGRTPAGIAQSLDGRGAEAGHPRGSVTCQQGLLLALMLLVLTYTVL